MSSPFFNLRDNQPYVEAQPATEGDPVTITTRPFAGFKASDTPYAAPDDPPVAVPDGYTRPATNPFNPYPVGRDLYTLDGTPDEPFFQQPDGA